MPSKKTKIIGCAVITEELRSKLPDETEIEILDFGLHRSPQMLHDELQKQIDKACDYENVVLAFGLCGMAIIGLHSETSTIIVPRADDCIAIFMGSRDAYLKEQREHTGTLFLSKGWIEGRIDDTPSDTDVYKQLLAKYGVDRARRMLEVYEKNQPFKHYKRMAFITTEGEADLDKYKEEAQRRAKSLGLVYEEIVGSPVFMEKIANEEWDDEFVIVPPGRPLTIEDFWRDADTTSADDSTK